ncbi:SGNH/GDSL hydrolase family protein [Actinomycetospora termitidis]|uniref:SGNH/GDSL hydrolase family protein n=1 Tax=Actinomycetospora termitidis TaxID=3053470 RepID=A0ABT7MGR1_9PSEU|nr:SGNH/GDSL hydrolase family protein [Actinomycetospora sp. Odt1-22]MDL5159132.1 SGNH/GDSL hydrolase family protein [Actinomycetospora sp. Odt1-22]
MNRYTWQVGQYWRRLRPGTRRGVTIGAAALVVVLVVVVVLGVVVRWNDVGTTADATDRGATVAVIGDSISQGTKLGGLGRANWTSIVGASRGWKVTDVAVGGTGYAYASPGTQTFAAGQLERAVAAGPGTVVVQGSRNDGLTPLPQVSAAAADLYRQLQERLPGVRLIVIGPVWSDGTITPSLEALSDAVRNPALAAGATYIDPIRENWFATAAGAQPPVIASDGVHPSDAGHRLIAEKVLRALERG